MYHSVSIIQANFNQNSNKCSHVKYIFTEGHKLHQIFLNVGFYTSTEHQYIVMTTLNYFKEKQEFCFLSNK